MAPLSRDNPLCTVPPSERDPSVVCEVITEDIHDFANKDKAQKEASLLLIEELLAPIVSELPPKAQPPPPSGSRGLHHPLSPPLPRQVLARGPEKTLNIEYPADEAAVQKLVRSALAKGQTVRVIGSGHSVAAAISDPTTPVLINLKNLRSIHITPGTGSAAAEVTVGGGCHLGRDPEDPESTLQNSLLYTINAAGYALPDLGGISHQTVAGFLSTGSAGGSVSDGLHDNVIALRFVNGLGEIVEYTRASKNPEFFAAGVSMGLFGVLTSVTFTLIENFFIQGTQTISPLLPPSTNPSEGCPIDVLGPGTKDIPSLQVHFTQNQFTRVIWWPQEGLNRLTIWKAKKVPVKNPATGEQWEIKEYEELPRIFGSSIPTQIAARIILLALNLHEADNPEYKAVAALLLGLFNPITQGGEAGAQTFCDWWWRALPMDNEISDTIMPVSFTELWFPIDQTQQIMNELNELFTTDFAAVGNFFTEVYAAKESPFWMSPGYGGNKVRVDATWFTANEKGNPADFFKPYWRIFEKRGYRCHWGKYTPEDYGVGVRARYQKYDEWMAVRAKMDPKQVSNLHWTVLCMGE